MIRRHSLVAAVLALVATILPATAHAFPERPISLIIPFVPGGVADITARTLAEMMEKELKQPVVIVNKPGAGTTIGGNAVATAKPDGYTLGYVPLGGMLPEAFSFFNEAPYTSKDLRIVSRVTTPVLTVVVKGDAPWNSLKDLVEYGRKTPIKVGSHGKNGQGYTFMSTMARAEKIPLIDVPFEGDAKIVPAVLGGHVPVGTPAFPAAKALIEAKKLKVLALLLEKRAEFAPELPTVIEAGYKLPYVSFLTVIAPRATPDDVIRKLDETIRKISATPEFRTRVHNTGTQVGYEDSATFEKTLVRYKDTLAAFFKDEGLVK
jgi:tripartite-type tricarboxylate transporter receptor subunit TctC